MTSKFVYVRFPPPRWLVMGFSVLGDIIMMLTCKFYVLAEMHHAAGTRMFEVYMLFQSLPQRKRGSCDVETSFHYFCSRKRSPRSSRKK